MCCIRYCVISTTYLLQFCIFVVKFLILFGRVCERLLYPVMVASGVSQERTIINSVANRLIGEVVQSRRRPLIGPSPG